MQNWKSQQRSRHSFSRGATVLTVGLVLTACGQSTAPVASGTPGLSGTLLAPLDAAQSGAVFSLTNACAGKVLDVAGASGSDGAQVIQATSNGSAHQQWKLEATDSGYYRLTAQHSGKVLDVAGGGTTNGTKVQQWAWGVGTNQQWKLTSLGNDQYKVTPRHTTGKALDVNGASKADGALVQIWDDNGTCAQRWTLKNVTPDGTVPPSAPVADDQTGPRAMRAADFVNTIGVNAHFERLQNGNSVWAKQQVGLRQKLLESGIPHIRTSHHGNMSTGSAYMTYLQSLTDVRINLQTDWTYDLTQLPKIGSDLGSKLVTLESRNEPDLRWVDGSAEKLRTLQKNLYDIRNANASLKNVKLLGPSVLEKWAADAVGDISTYVDYLNAHMYTGTSNPESIFADGGSDGSGYGSVRAARAMHSVMGGDKCLMVTETGEHNYFQQTSGHLGTNEKIAGRVTPRIYLELARRGVCRTFIYELVDEPFEGVEGNFGLLRGDLSEKPAFKAVKGMVALLKDGASNSASFTPGQLNYTLTGNTGSVSHMLFQKSEGTFVLAVWLGKRAWDWKNRVEVAVPNQSVTLNVPTRRGATLNTLDDAGVMTRGSTQTLVDGRLSLSVSDRVTFIELR